MKNREAPSMVIISYPKSGRTWMKILLQEYGNKAGVELPRVLFTHIGFGFTSESQHVRYIQQNPSVPLVHLSRNPADTLVSFYHDDKVRQPKKLINRERIDQYVLHYIPHIKEFYHKASKYEYKHKISYERMHEDCAKEVAPIIQTLCGEVQLDKLQEAVEHCEFSRLYGAERSGKIDMRVRAGHQELGFYKTRRGIVGSAQDELRPETYHILKKEFKL